MKKLFNSPLMRSGFPTAASIVIGISSNLFTKDTISINTIFLNIHFWLIVIAAIILIIYQKYIFSVDKNSKDDIAEKYDKIVALLTTKPTASEISETPVSILFNIKQSNSSSNTVKLLMDKRFIKLIDRLAMPDREKLNRFLHSIYFQNISQLLSSGKLHKVIDSDAYVFRITTDLRVVVFIDKSKNEIILANIDNRR